MLSSIMRIERIKNRCKKQEVEYKIESIESGERLYYKSGWIYAFIWYSTKGLAKNTGTFPVFCVKIKKGICPKRENRKGRRYR